jgi:thioredoxin-dependent peroxiredoxin
METRVAAGLDPGSAVANFTLPGGVLDGDVFVRRDYSLNEERGHPLLLAFYPGDNSTMCTRQMCAYSTGLEQFTELGAQVWGISPQDVDSHEGFAKANNLRFPLLADTGREVARAFGIAAPGIGLRRSVFLIAPDGTLLSKHVSLFGATWQPAAALAAELATLKHS